MKAYFIISLFLLAIKQRQMQMCLFPLQEGSMQANCGPSVSSWLDKISCPCHLSFNSSTLFSRLIKLDFSICLFHFTKSPSKIEFFFQLLYLLVDTSADASVNWHLHTFLKIEMQCFSIEKPPNDMHWRVGVDGAIEENFLCFFELVIVACLCKGQLPVYLPRPLCLASRLLLESSWLSIGLCNFMVNLFATENFHWNDRLVWKGKKSWALWKLSKGSKEVDVIIYNLQSLNYSAMKLSRIANLAKGSIFPH